MHERPPDVPSDLNNSLTLQLKSLFLNDQARLVLNAQAGLQGRDYLSPLVCTSRYSSQTGPQGPASIPIIIIK